MNYDYDLLQCAFASPVSLPLSPELPSVYQGRATRSVYWLHHNGPIEPQQLSLSLTNFGQSLRCQQAAYQLSTRVFLSVTTPSEAQHLVPFCTVPTAIGA
jgi:hypothetical protein